MLSGPEILRRMQAGDIVIDPFDPAMINPNSVNLHLSDQLLVYDLRVERAALGEWLYDPGASRPLSRVIDMKADNPTREITIPENGFLLEPGTLYLGATQEHTETRKLVPVIEGRSGVGRLGLQVHVTAGFGDELFKGTWTLELTTVHPLRIYAGVAICQIAYSELIGESLGYCGKYQGQKGPRASRLWREFIPPSQ